MKTRFNQGREGCFLSIDRRPSPRVDHPVELTIPSHAGGWTAEWTQAQSVSRTVKKGIHQRRRWPGTLGHCGPLKYSLHPVIQNTILNFFFFFLDIYNYVHNGGKNQEETAFFPLFYSSHFLRLRYNDLLSK